MPFTTVKTRSVAEGREPPSESVTEAPLRRLGKPATEEGTSLQVLREELATFCFSELLSTFQGFLEDLTFCICRFRDGLVLLRPVCGMFVG